jgi:hypothetical protein
MIHAQDKLGPKRPDISPCQSASSRPRAADSRATGADAEDARNAAEAGYVASKRLLTLAGVSIRQHVLQRPLVLGRSSSSVSASAAASPLLPWAE